MRMYENETTGEIVCEDCIKLYLAINHLTLSEVRKIESGICGLCYHDQSGVNYFALNRVLFV